MKEAIYELAIMYRNSEVPEAKKAYDQYVKIIVEDAPKKERSNLLKIWEWEIE